MSGGEREAVPAGDVVEDSGAVEPDETPVAAADLEPVADDEPGEFDWIPAQFRRDSLEASTRALLESYVLAQRKITEQAEALKAFREVEYARDGLPASTRNAIRQALADPELRTPTLRAIKERIVGR